MTRSTTVRIAILAALAIVALPLVANAQTGVLFVVNNKVGIGTSTPSDPLHVKSTTAGNKVMTRLSNNGAPFLFYENTGLGVTWGINPTGAGDFTITKTGTGGAEMTIQQNGQVTMGPGGLPRFRLDPVGNVTIQGTLTQMSSRAFKEGFTPLDSREVLDRVTRLEVPEWSYKQQSERHIGPMAEEFRAAFGLGAADTGLAPGDLAGVTLVALQGLYDVVQEKDQRIAELSQELAELRTLVEALAAR